MEELMTTREAAEYLGIKPQTLRKWRMQGKIKPIVESHGEITCMHTKTDLDSLLTKGFRHVR